MTIQEQAKSLRGVAFSTLACAVSFALTSHSPRSVLQTELGFIVCGCRTADNAAADGRGVVVA